MPSKITEGLSPRVRGNLNLMGLIEIPKGSIPARAGEPAFRLSCNLDHTSTHNGLSPRVRGNPSLPWLSLFCQGLSPRVRGNPLLLTC